MRADRRTTTPRDAELHNRNHGIDDTGTPVITADDVAPMGGGHDCDGDPSCWTCFILPAAYARLRADIGRNAA